MITKLADAILQEHQQRVLDRLRNSDAKGLVAYHSMGSGKTLTALKALQEANERTGKRGLFVAPASLVDNAWKEVGKHGIPLSKDDLDVMSYERAANHVDDLLAKNYGMVVFDEAHRLRNAGTKRAMGMRRLIDASDKALLLTGTAGYNSPTDISQLVRLVNPKSRLPTSMREFEAAYVNPADGSLRNTGRLRKEISPYVDTYERPSDASAFPSVREEIVRVPMSDRQSKVYRYLEEKLPIHLRGAVRDRLPLGLQDSANLNVFATGIRQASVSPMHHDTGARPEDSPKLVEAARRMALAAKAPHFRGVAYSNYIDSGITPYSELLRRRGIDPLVLTGSLSAKEKKALVDRFNAPGEDPRVLLLSSSGGEGLDLKGVRRMQILEPHFNEAKIDQVKARGARYMSHADLPESERNVLVENYRSAMPKTFFQRLLGREPDGAIDDWLADAAARKQNTINQMRSLIAENGR